MDHKNQITEFSNRLDELIDYHAKEFTELTFAAIIGVLLMKVIELTIKPKS